AGAAVPAPSLAGHYAKLRGSSVAGQILEGAGVGAVGGWIGAGVGALTGAIRGVGGEFQRLLEGLTWLVRPPRLPPLVWAFPPWVRPSGHARPLSLCPALGPHARGAV